MLESYRDVLTVKELAEVLRIGKNAAYALVRNREIMSVRLGKRYLVPKKKVVEFLEKM
jgi:excisionase family DNA binding protein